tara:strand:+ start:221 stop:439 length:219 start_codon:yes stop_codon:yes gene_type:complete
MQKSPLYLLGVLGVLLGLIPIANNVFSTNLLGGNPFFFLVGGIWSILLAVIFYSSKKSKNKCTKKDVFMTSE